MVEEWAAIGAVLLLSLVTFATRIGGVWIMSNVPITPRIEAFLKYMAASVLIAIVVPATLSGSARIWVAVAAAVVTMAASGSALGAMLIGTALAAIGRGLGF
jgi:branched chain amino acid efflux pump